MQLNLSHISYTYEGASSPALADVSVTFPESWTGLIGDNGCGKTTLALIASGLITPDSGIITPQLYAAYCPQDTSVVPTGLTDLASDWSSEALKIRDTLAIDDAWLWDYEHLSGGQKKRVQIACALWQRPDVLVLDEPTNDLDAPTREHVRESLELFKGVGILISHDRTLLDALVGQCAVFENGRVIMRPGGYSKVAGQISDERSSQAKAHDAARREERRLKNEAQRRTTEAARSSSRLSAKRLDKHDSDGRDRLGRAKVSSKDSIAGRAAGAMATRVDRAKEAAEDTRTTKRYDTAIELPGKPVRSKFVLHVEPCDLRADDEHRAEDANADSDQPASAANVSYDQHASGLTIHVPELWIEPDEHVGISGANGVGKTTLIRHLRSLVPDHVECAFIPQEVNAQLRQETLARLHALNDVDKGRVLSLVAGLNTDPATLREGSNISPGEMKKLLIAEQLLKEPNLLILDEPTNHLDVGSIEALQRALEAFPAAIILVTHDAQLLNAVSATHWLLERTGDNSTLYLK